MDAFTIRDLRERTGELVRDAESGKLSVVTKHGRPLFVAVPLDDDLVRHGLRVALAAKLYQEEVVSLGKAARLADLAVEAFIEKLALMGVPVVNYPAEELDEEIAALG